MSLHLLQGRSPSELLWFQRRQFLQAAAVWAASGGYAAAQVQSRSNVIELSGDTLVNGQPLRRGQSIASGDTVQTGPGSHLVFVIGDAAFQVRQDSQLVVERGNSINSVGLLRLTQGGVISVWGDSQRRQIITPTLTAGLRSTGTYVEIPALHPDRTYFCNCYGEVQLNSGESRLVSRSAYHQAYWADGGDDGSALNAGQFINHTDDEVEYLARLIGQKTLWQRSGVKGLAPKISSPGLPGGIDGLLE